MHKYVNNIYVVLLETELRWRLLKVIVFHISLSVFKDIIHSNGINGVFLFVLFYYVPDWRRLAILVLLAARDSKIRIYWLVDKIIRCFETYIFINNNLCDLSCKIINWTENNLLNKKKKHTIYANTERNQNYSTSFTNYKLILDLQAKVPNWEHKRFTTTISMILKKEKCNMDWIFLQLYWCPEIKG